MTKDGRMQLGIVGLGRMGANIARRLMRDGHTCVVYDVNPDAVSAVAADGATGAGSLAELAAALEPPRAVWVMVPAGEITESTVRDVAAALEPGDTIVDGGNTYYRDDIRRERELAERGIRYLDCGTSGGVFGLERGFSLMVGGDAEAFAALAPILRSLAETWMSCPTSDPIAPPVTMIGPSAPNGPPVPMAMAADSGFATAVRGATLLRRVSTASIASGMPWPRMIGDHFASNVTIAPPAMAVRTTSGPMSSVA
jgi:6-phosphogluconate dehydrogenase